MATRPLPEAAESRFAPYIAELHEFFATSRVPFGSPEDIPGVMDRLREPGTFSKDLGSLIRSFVLRQGGAMPHAQLMEILSFAIAGPEMATSPQRYREPLRELLRFLAGVMNRPWNVPPGERLEAEIVPFPNEFGGSTAEIDALSGTVDPVEVAPWQQVEPTPPPDPATPIAEREPLVETAAPPLLAGDAARPETLPDSTTLAAENTASEALPVEAAPMSAISAALAAESERAGHESVRLEPIARVPEAEPLLQPVLQASPIPAPVPKENAADERHPAVPRDVLIAVAGGLMLAAILVVAYRARKPAEVSAVQPSGTSPVAGAPAPTTATPFQPQTPSPETVSRPYDAGTPSPAKPSADGAPSPGHAFRQTHGAQDDTSSPDIAIPYSSAPEYSPQHVFGKALATSQPTASPAPLRTPPPQQTTASATDSPAVSGGNLPANSGATAQPVPAPIVRVPARSAPRDPDAIIAGDSRASREFSSSERPAFFSVSSGVMASNLISSPAPDYPMIARIAHIRGQVVLRAVITRSGSVSSTRVLSGNRLLRGAAQNAVQRWRYRPYRVNGRPVDVATIVTVDFQKSEQGEARGSGIH